MKRVLPILTLIVACRPTEKSPAEDTVRPTATPVSAALPKLDTVGGPVADSDSVPWNRYPRVLANECFGETCSTKFPAVACREVRLRTAAADNATLDVTVGRNDTVTVTQTDLHLEGPGVVVFRRAYVKDWVDVDGDIRPSSDTLRFAARSYPKMSTWWHVSLKDGRRGFWKFDQEAWREGLKPHAKYWEVDCPTDKSGSTEVH